MVAQALVIRHPELVRKLILTRTGPAGGEGIDKVAGTTYYDMLRVTLSRRDPEEFLFFNRDDIGKGAGRAFIERLEERTEDRDTPITVKPFRTQLKATKRWGRSTSAALSIIPQPTLIANGDNDRMVPTVLRRHTPPHCWLETHHLSQLRSRRDLSVPRRIRYHRNRVH